MNEIKIGDKVKHPNILEPLTVVRIGETEVVLKDGNGYKYDSFIDDLEVVNQYDHKREDETNE